VSLSFAINPSELCQLRWAQHLFSELYARAEVRAVEGVSLVEGRNQRSWNIEDEAILKKFSGLKIPKAYHHTKKVLSPAQLTKLTWVDGRFF
jgi:hypothetical protein